MLTYCLNRGHFTNPFHHQDGKEFLSACQAEYVRPGLKMGKQNKILWGDQCGSVCHIPDGVQVVQTKRAREKLSKRIRTHLRGPCDSQPIGNRNRDWGMFKMTREGNRVWSQQILSKVQISTNQLCCSFAVHYLDSCEWREHSLLARFQSCWCTIRCHACHRTAICIPASTPPPPIDALIMKWNAFKRRAAPTPINYWTKHIKVAEGRPEKITIYPARL